jgi:hypothetical protein
MADELTAEEVASLRAVAGGTRIKVDIPEPHKEKLVSLGYAEIAAGNVGATAKGRAYLRNLRR